MTYPIAQVVVGLPVPGPFDYIIPEPLQDQIRVGHRVYVPFTTKSYVGYVVGLLSKSEFPRLKSLTAILENIPILDEKTLKWAQEFSESYACSLGEAIETFLPTALRSKKQIVWTPPKTVPGTVREPKLIFCPRTLAHAGAVVAERIKAVITSQRGVIVLVAEHKQIEETRQYFEKQFGIKAITLDKDFTANYKLQEWLLIKEGKARVVIGTRSAIFVPMPRTGLIVMMDEENSAYKQEPSPFYHAREVALMRQKYDQCDILFVTPAPSAELWKILKDRNAIFETLPDVKLANLQTIDLTNYKPQANMPVSFPLQNHIQETLLKNGKVLLFLNRRGFSLKTKCNQCGFTIQCPRCNVNLSFLYSKRKLVCHQCGTTAELPKFCPQCRSAYLRSTGTGIEKLESHLVRIYPGAKIALFDRDTKDFPMAAHIVIATQAILPFVDLAAFSLIAVLDFDGEINRVDFRAGQRVFSLLMRLRQAALDKLTVQTTNPNHEAIKAAMAMDLEKFYKAELKTRRNLELPPFTHVLALALRGKNENAVFERAKDLFGRLNEISPDEFELSEPQPDLTPKLRDQFRFIIMLKGRKVETIVKTISPLVLEFKKQQGIILTVDVDP